MPDALAETMIPPSGPTMADLLGKVAPALSATSDLPADVPAVVKAPPTSASNEAPSKDAAVPADKPVDAKDDSATKTEHVEDEPDSGEQGDATDAAPVADAKAKTPRGVQKRLDELTAQRAAAEQRAVEADKRAAEAIELANRLSREKSEKEAAIAAAEPRPTRDKFDDPDKYDAALIDWSARQTARSTEAQIEKRRAEERQADELRQQKQDQSTRQKEWGQKREKALQEMPDYAEVAEVDAEQVPVADEASATLHGRIRRVLTQAAVPPEGLPRAEAPTPMLKRAAGDLVIDGSIKGRLERLATELAE